jgi:hypothetical protein
MLRKSQTAQAADRLRLKGLSSEGVSSERGQTGWLRRAFLHSILRWGGLGALAALGATTVRQAAPDTSVSACRMPSRLCEACVQFRQCRLPRALAVRQGKDPA